MNILVVCQYGLYQDLTSSFVHAQVREYTRLGHSVRVIIPTALGKTLDNRKIFPFAWRRCVDGVELYYVRFLSISNYGENGFNAASAKYSIQIHLHGILTDFIPDVIHAHTLGLSSEVGTWLKSKLDIPLVVTTHGSDTSVPVEQEEGAKLYAYCRGVDQIVAVSSVLGNKLRTCGTDTPITAILNGYAAQNCRSKTEKKNLSFLQVGHLQTQKRPEITIRAFAKIHAVYPEARLTLVGQGPEREKLEKLCRELRIEKAVHFTGQVSNSEVLSEMAQTQFFIMPSVREGLGIVYLEAMASGCITIGTQGEGISDLIISGKNGFLVPPDDPDAIVNVVDWCLKNPEDATMVAQRGQQDAKALTWKKNALQYINLFEQELKQ